MSQIDVLVVPRCHHSSGIARVTHQRRRDRDLYGLPLEALTPAAFKKSLG